MKKKVRTPESNQFHNFEEGVVSFYDKLKKNYVNTREVVLHFSRPHKMTKKKCVKQKCIGLTKLMQLVFQQGALKIDVTGQSKASTMAV